MASVTFKNGRALIQWVDSHADRKSLRYADSRRGAEQTALHIEKLNIASVSRSTMPRDTAAWLAEIGDKLHAKLVKHGLVQERAEKEQPITELAAFLDGYMKDRTDITDGTKSNFKQVKNYLVKHFGARQDITLINRGEMKDWHRFIQKNLAPATVAMHVKRARQMFEDAIERNLIVSNPTKGIKAGRESNPDRMVYIPVGDIQRVIDACPDAEWRLIFALARYGGLRVPSEPLQLLWSDVQWEQSRIVVRSPKTKRHEGKDKRIVPIFPELLPYLLECFEAAEPGDERVIVNHRGQNLRTNAHRIIDRAGLTIWGKPFQNLRSSRETDLADRFPIHVVCQWIGNSEIVARRHYLQVKEMHFDQATGKSAAPGAAVSVRQEATGGHVATENRSEITGKTGIDIPAVGVIKLKILEGFPKISQKALHRALRRIQIASPALLRATRAQLRRERGRR